jgi:flagellar hook-basal body protein
MTYEPASVLSGLLSDPMVAASEDWKVDDSTGQVKSGGTAKVSGTVTLSKSDLTMEPYNLIPTTDASGKVTGYSKALTDGSTTVTDLGTDVDNWKKALGLSSLTAAPTIQDDGSISISFEKEFTVTQDAEYDSNTKQFKSKLTGDDILKAYGVQNDANATYTIQSVSADGTQAQITKTVDDSGSHLYLNTDNGNFDGIGTQGSDNTSKSIEFLTSATSLKGDTIDLTNFTNISIDFSKVFSSNNGGTSTISATSGDLQGYNTGRKYGDMIGVEVAQDGKIRASYDNGQTKLLGQISVANFANASGLSKSGNNLYSTTMNSGEFDGIGEDITSSGGTMESGVLEMSNVDLSSEFTNMITTQRGFQANSRIITVSDSMLEELVNLKR